MDYMFNVLSNELSGPPLLPAINLDPSFICLLLLTGTLMATTCWDRKLRLFDPRAGSEPDRVAEADKVATTGFSKRSDRQLSIWETGGLENVQTMTIDQSAGVIMPFWSDNGILFLGEHLIMLKAPLYSYHYFRLAKGKTTTSCS